MVESYEIPNDIKVKYQLSTEDMSLMRANFKAYDANGDGTIEKTELHKILKDLGMGDLSDEKVDEVFNAIDTNSNSVIEYIEFVHLFGQVKDKGVEALSKEMITVKGAGTRTETASGGHHTYAHEEVSVGSRFINNCLEEDEELKAILPINPDSEDLFYQMSNG